MDDNRKYAIPFAAAIIERQHEGKLQFLIQVRNHKNTESIYNGTLEFAAGSLDKLYENIYETLNREVMEETGLTVSQIINDDKTEVFSPQQSDAVFGFRPFCCTQQLKDGRPWIGLIFRCNVEPGEPRAQDGENQDVQWMDASEFKNIFINNPEKIFSIEYPAWDYYFKEVDV